ncbi:hypothetical protein BGW42_004013 [Actinomortierella wolfii]|nr:hypothetical protein BGW42_004013 [Actinomortierella wolfii]
MNANFHQKQHGHSEAFEELMIVTQLLDQAQARYADQAAFKAQWTKVFVEQAFAWTSHLSKMLARQDDPKALVDTFLLSLQSKPSDSKEDIPWKESISTSELVNPTTALLHRLLGNPSLDVELVPILFQLAQQQNEGNIRPDDSQDIPSHVADMVADGAFQNLASGVMRLLRTAPVCASLGHGKGQAEWERSINANDVEKRALARTLYQRATLARHDGAEKENETSPGAIFLQQTRNFVNAVGQDALDVIEKAILISLEKADDASTMQLQRALLAAREQLEERKMSGESPGMAGQDKSLTALTQFTQFPVFLQDDDWDE